MLWIEKHNIVQGFAPVDLQTAANNGDWVSMKLYGKIAVIFLSAVGTAADDPTITLQQATAVAGTGAKDLDFTVIHTKQAATDLSSTGIYTRVTQTAANTFTNGTSAEEDLIWVIEFDADQLDADNGFDCVRATVADIGGNAQLGALLYDLTEPRYPEDILASAIVD
jgi:hypothetical protein